MASFDLWLDGDDMEESAGWKQPVSFNFDRFVNEPEYADIINRHIKQTLAHLAREIEELELQIPPGTYQRVDIQTSTSCE